jgi:hypothetical protein
MKFTNKTLFWVMMVFTLLNLCDVVTTMFIFEGEANPLFNAVNNFGIIILLKFLIVGFIWIFVLRNLYPNHMSYFMLIAVVVYGSVALLIAQIININGIFNPEIIQRAASTAVIDRTNYYFTFMSVIYLIPIIFSLLCFWIYNRSYKTTIIDKEISRKNKWRIWSIQR